MAERIRMNLRAAVALVLLAWPTVAAAQEGVGSTGATVLQLPAGSRAAALSGAYVAASGDADVLFYNPAGAAALGAAASLAFQRHIAQIAYGSAAGALALGPVVLGLAVTYLDAGEIDVTVPDPAFGGQTGLETGQTTGARESAARLAVALPLGRLRLGAGAGIVTSNLAGVQRSAPLFDVGAQFELPVVTLGASIRNIGPAMSGDDGADAPLPTEARIGARVERSLPGSIGVVFGADLASDLNAGTTRLIGGIEAGLLPGADRRLGAVARIGVDGDAIDDDDTLSGLRFGAGITLDRIALDYTYQDFEFFRAIHRFGIRWSRAPR